MTTPTFWELSCLKGAASIFRDLKLWIIRKKLTMLLQVFHWIQLLTNNIKILQLMWPRLIFQQISTVSNYQHLLFIFIKNLSSWYLFYLRFDYLQIFTIIYDPSFFLSAHFCFFYLNSQYFLSCLQLFYETNRLSWGYICLFLNFHTALWKYSIQF